MINIFTGQTNYREDKVIRRESYLFIYLHLQFTKSYLTSTTFRTYIDCKYFASIFIETKVLDEIKHAGYLTKILILLFEYYSESSSWWLPWSWWNIHCIYIYLIVLNVTTDAVFFFVSCNVILRFSQRSDYHNVFVQHHPHKRFRFRYTMRLL